MWQINKNQLKRPGKIQNLSSVRMTSELTSGEPLCSYKKITKQDFIMLLMEFGPGMAEMHTTIIFQTLEIINYPLLKSFGSCFCFFMCFEGDKYADMYKSI